jgi:hypothetical protein
MLQHRVPPFASSCRPSADSLCHGDLALEIWSPRPHEIVSKHEASLFGPNNQNNVAVCSHLDNRSIRLHVALRIAVGIATNVTDGSRRIVSNKTLSIIDAAFLFDESIVPYMQQVQIRRDQYHCRWRAGCFNLDNWSTIHHLQFESRSKETSQTSSRLLTHSTATTHILQFHYILKSSRCPRFAC